MKHLQLHYILVLIAFILSYGCKNDESIDPSLATGLITEVQIIFSTSGAPNEVARYSDIDGPGGTDPVFTSVDLQSNTQYDVTIEILNQQSNPVHFIHTRIENEPDFYQLFYQSSPLLNLDFTYTDQDNNGNPVGLRTIATTGPVSNGVMNVVLRHNLDKSAEGVAEGDQTQAGGMKDMDLDFDVNVN